jgi:hypothetical protein
MRNNNKIIKKNLIKNITHNMINLIVKFVLQRFKLEKLFLKKKNLILQITLTIIKIKNNQIED